MNKKILYAFGLISFLTVGKASAQQASYLDLLKQQPHWVDSVFNKLSTKHKIAQLFFVRAHTNLSKAYQDSVGKVIKREKLGGVVFFQGGPVRQAVLTNKYQSKSKIPLIISIDGEWGLGMRLDSTISYPYQMALGAVQNKELLYKMGLEVAKDFKRLGIQMNLAPDVDVNNNAKNPVINFRSFGENKYNVAEKSAVYLKGMQEGGLLVSIKHFPGHGDTDVDSHYDLPQLKFTKERLDTLELYPFKELIKKGAAGVMIAHMNIPSLDATPNLPSTLSKPIVTDLLKNELGFKGLIISDAMDMKGVTKYYKDGEAEVMGIIAGNDILELAHNTKEAVKKIKQAIKDERISMERIDESVKKVLIAKYWAGLNVKPQIDENNVVEDINRPESQALVQQLADASVTLLKSRDGISSLTPKKRTVIINVGTTQATTFQNEIVGTYKNSIAFNVDRNANAATIAGIMKQIQDDDQIVMAIVDTRTRPGNNIPLGKDVKDLITTLSARNAMVAFFANPYNLANLPGIEMARSIVVAYQKEDFMQKAAAAVFTKKLMPTGKLPVTVNGFFKYGDGL
ncbi:glycoside hydrolase family 3 protein [Pedobacter sp. SL55]|uniref:glycoside hydrolase family 3 protein n=1 Tax=Pedobacter sp. SL55 TaxID=2995161 RepID=UPI00226D4C5E|nr:glycoside hydrolase family 3 protein [Pedobacter sp. SL55]WAC41941.1 glycoside hydrolase family 3 protein [Pedobacter sp. SL55]